MWSDIIQHGVKLIECSFSQVRSLALHVVIFVQKLRFLENCDFKKIVVLRIFQTQAICFEINVGKRRIRHRTTLNLN